MHYWAVDCKKHCNLFYCLLGPDGPGNSKIKCKFSKVYYPILYTHFAFCQITPKTHSHKNVGQLLFWHMHWLKKKSQNTASLREGTDAFIWVFLTCSFYLYIYFYFFAEIRAGTSSAHKHRRHVDGNATDRVPRGVRDLQHPVRLVAASQSGTPPSLRDRRWQADPPAIPADGSNPTPEDAEELRDDDVHVPTLETRSGQGHGMAPATEHNNDDEPRALNTILVWKLNCVFCALHGSREFGQGPEPKNQRCGPWGGHPPNQPRFWLCAEQMHDFEKNPPQKRKVDQHVRPSLFSCKQGRCISVEAAHMRKGTFLVLSRMTTTAVWNKHRSASETPVYFRQGTIFVDFVLMRRLECIKSTWTQCTGYLGCIPKKCDKKLLIDT